jgi:hypothetical protein
MLSLKTRLISARFAKALRQVTLREFRQRFFIEFS